MQTNLSMEKFNPNKEKLNALADQYRDLSINGIDDKEGYQRVHEARMELKKARIEITKTGKGLRADALAFQKNVIALEKDLVGIIEPVEKELKAKQDAIDEDVEKQKRVEHLPYRYEQLAEIGVEQTDDFLLSMDHDQFAAYLVEEKAKYLEAKEAKMREEQEKIDAEKRRQEQQKLDEQRAIELEEAKKQAAKDAVKRERERKALEEQKQKEREEKKRKEMENEVNFKAFLDEHGVTQEMRDSGQYRIMEIDDSIVLYKLVGILKLNK